MKKLKFFAALIVMLFVSTSVFGQTIPTTTFVQDTPVALINKIKECSVTVKWVGTDGTIIQAPTYTTTLSALAAGVNVTMGLIYAISTGFYPIVETIVEVTYSYYEKHVGIYPGIATVLSRERDPEYWIVKY